MRPSPQELVRCPWVGLGDAAYTRYHDEEWGVPVADDRALFEKIVLEGFQAGLSWRTILNKRENFRAAFQNFAPERIARFGQRDIERLMQDEGIVRNRMKIEAAIDNARACLKLAERVPLAYFIWEFLDGRPLAQKRTAISEIPAETELSRRISKALKNEGFRFVGSTTVYTFMQSVGMVNDHLVTCHRHRACATLQQAFRLPAR